MSSDIFSAVVVAIVFSLLISDCRGQLSFFTNNPYPDAVQVHENYDHVVDLWDIEALCHVDDGFGRNTFKPCDTCYITDDPCGCLQMSNGLTVQKVQCVDPLCGPTCSATGCLNAGDLFKGDIKCNHSIFSMADPVDFITNFILNVTDAAKPEVNLAEGNVIEVNRNQMETPGTVINSIVGIVKDDADDNDVITTYGEAVTSGAFVEIVNGPEFAVDTITGEVYVNDTSRIDLSIPALFRISGCVYDRRERFNCAEVRIVYTALYTTTTTTTTEPTTTTTTTTEPTTTTTTEPTTTTTTEPTTTTSTTTEPTTSTTTEPTTTTTTTEPTTTTTTEPTTSTTTTEPTTTTTTEPTTTTTTEPTTTTTTTEPTTTTTTEPTTSTTTEPTTTTTTEPTTSTATEPTTTTSTTTELTTTTTSEPTTTTTTEPSTTSTTTEPVTPTTTTETTTTSTTTELSTTTTASKQTDSDKCSSSGDIGVIIGSVVAGLGHLSVVGLIGILLLLRENTIEPCVDTGVVKAKRNIPNMKNRRATRKRK